MASKVKSDFRAELFLELDVVSPFSLRMSPRALFTLVGSRMPLAILDHIGTQATGIEGLNTAASDHACCMISKFVSRCRGVFRTFELRVLTVIDCPKIADAKGR